MFQRKKLREERNQLLQFVLESFKDRVVLAENVNISSLNYDQINVQSVIQSLKEGIFINVNIRKLRKVIETRKKLNLYLLENN